MSRWTRPHQLHVLAVQVFGSCHGRQVVGFCCRLTDRRRRRSGARRRGTSLASAVLKSSSMSETHKAHRARRLKRDITVRSLSAVHVAVSSPFSLPSK
ncbi:hypothetical protein EYF80_015484 [Liparis tanakae]|uniref:Uncharacterized protein n=1 Tax=Liparis tanakae TaxID=230148 RepID=A0A4Z2I920_9TELE|nr:hypothetical protein EYF80_015484 [Liparis tanakae]